MIHSIGMVFQAKKRSPPPRDGRVERGLELQLGMVDRHDAVDVLVAVLAFRAAHDYRNDARSRGGEPQGLLT